MDSVTKALLLKSSLDDPALPPKDPTWGNQLINLADDGDFYRGMLVYLAVRVGFSPIEIRSPEVLTPSSLRRVLRA